MTWRPAVFLASLWVLLGCIEPVQSDQPDVASAREFVSAMRRGNPVSPDLDNRVREFFTRIDNDQFIVLGEYDQIEVAEAIAWKRDASVALRLLASRDEVSSVVHERLRGALFIASFVWTSASASEDLDILGRAVRSEGRDSASLSWASDIVTKVKVPDQLEAAERKIVMVQLMLLAEKRAIPEQAQRRLLSPFLDCVLREPVSRSDLRAIVAMALGSFSRELAAWRGYLDRIESKVDEWDSRSLQIGLAYANSAFHSGMGRHGAERLKALFERVDLPVKGVICGCLSRLGRKHGVDALLELLDSHASGPVSVYIKASLAHLLEVQGGEDRGPEWWRRRADEE